MSQRETDPFSAHRTVRVIGAVVALATLLAACSDLYFDRRDTIALSGGDAVAANAAEQTVDPWPPYSGNNNIAFNGDRMQRAVECYRANKVIRPIDFDLASSPGAAQAAAAASACEGRIGPGSLPPATTSPVKNEAAK